MPAFAFKIHSCVFKKHLGQLKSFACFISGIFYYNLYPLKLFKTVLNLISCKDLYSHCLFDTFVIYSLEYLFVFNTITLKKLEEAPLKIH